MWKTFKIKKSKKNKMNGASSKINLKKNKPNLLKESKQLRNSPKNNRKKKIKVKI